MATGDQNITKEQLDIAKSLSDVMKQLAQSQEALMSLGSTFEQMTSTAAKSADKLTDSSKTTTHSIASMNNEAKKASGILHSKFPIATAAAIGGVVGLYQNIKRLTQILRTATGLIKGTAEALLDIGASIVSIPFKMFNGLIDIVNNASGGANELLTAIENIRKEFGALSQGTPQAIMKMAKEMRGFSDTGLSAWRIFGKMSQRLEDILKLSQEMGASFESFREEMVSNGGAILAWQKGLGLTGEQMAIVAQRAKSTGTSMSKQFIDVQKQVDALSDEFKVSSKLISRDMVKAMADLKHFGSSTVKEIASAAVYARKLGLELDKIVSTLDAFDTFESAAENASMLSQAFGVQVDAFQLMKAQSPDEIIESLRKSFREANVDVTKFDRASKSLLATTTGLSAEVATQALSLHNQGVSLDQIRTKAGAAEKKQLTQAEAMEKLASAIERLVLSGGQQSGGFFDKFIHGMMGGIQRGEEFRGIMMNIRAAFRTVYWEGVRFGKAIADIPGVKDFLGAIKSFFDPKKFGTLVRGVTDELIKFVKGEQSFPELMKKLKEQFFDYFDANSEAGKKFLNGVKAIFKGLANVAADAMKWMAERVRDGIMFITDLLTGKRKLDLSAVTQGAGFLGEVLAPMIDALKYSWKTVAPALGELFSVLGGMIEKFFNEKIVPTFKRFAPEIAIGLFGPAFAKAAFAAITAAFAQSQLRKALSGGVGDAMKSIVASATAGPNPVAPIADAGLAAAGPMGAVSKVSAASMVASGVKMAAIAVGISVGAIALAGAFVAMKEILSAGKLTTQEILGNAAILGTLVIASAGVAMTMTILGKVPTNMMPRAVGGLLGAVVAVGALGLLGVAIIKLFDDVDIAKMGPAGDFLLKMSAVTLAMVPVLFGAAALGALVIGSLGMGLIAIAAGMGLILGAVGAVALMAKSVMSEVNDMKISSDFQVKINAFLGILESLRSFAQLLVNLVSLMTPTLGELLFGGPTFVQKVNATIDLLKNFVGERGGKVGIIPVVELVVEKIREISGLGDIDQAANSFSSILTSVTGLMEALKPNDAFFKSKEGFVGLARLIAGDNGVSEVNAYVTAMSDQLVKLIKGGKDGKGGLNEMIEAMASVTVPDPAKLKVIGETLGSLSGLVKAVLPDPELFNKFMDDEKFDPTRFLWFLDDYFPRMQAVLSSIIKIGVDDIIKSLDQIGDPEKFKKLLVVGDVLKTIAELVKNLMDMGSGGGKTNIEKIEVGTLASVTGKLQIATGPIQSLAQTISEMGPALAGLITSITVATLLVPNDKGFKGKVETLKSMLEVMKLVPSLIKDVAEVNKEAAKSGATGDYTPASGSILDAITNAKTLLDNMIGGDRLSQLGATMKTAADAIPKGMSANMTKVESFVTKLASTVRNLKSLSDAFKTSGGERLTASELSQSVVDSIDAVKTVADAMSPKNTSGGPLGMLSEAFGASARAEITKINADLNLYARQIDALAKNFKTGGVSRALSAFSDMSKKVSELDAALSALPVIDIDAKLKAVASGLGMSGKKFEYSLKSKEIVIEVNFNVEVKASDLEQAVIMNSKSFVRDRLNMLLDNVNPVPDLSTPVPSPTRLTIGQKPTLMSPNRN